MNDEELEMYMLEPHEGLIVYKNNNDIFYSLEGKGIVLSMGGHDLQFYVRPECRGEGLSLKYLTKILNTEFEIHNSLQVTFQDRWFEKAFFERIKHKNIMIFKTATGFYLVNEMPIGAYIQNPLEFKL